MDTMEANGVRWGEVLTKGALTQTTYHLWKETKGVGGWGKLAYTITMQCLYHPLSFK